MKVESSGCRQIATNIEYWLQTTNSLDRKVSTHPGLEKNGFEEKNFFSKTYMKRFARHQDCWVDLENPEVCLRNVSLFWEALTCISSSNIIQVVFAEWVWKVGFCHCVVSTVKHSFQIQWLIIIIGNSRRAIFGCKKELKGR